MSKIIPEKLKKGDEIRIIAPSRSMKILGGDVIKIAKERLEHMGYKVSLIGGNLCTLNLLQGTEYMPNEENIILFLEDDDLVKNEFVREFDRDLQSLIHSMRGKNIKGLVIGRAEKEANMTENKWMEIIETKKNLKIYLLL